MPLRATRNSKKSTIKGEIFIVSAPSGAGKTTLCRKLCKTVPRLKHSVSYTTRDPRKKEINNIHYTFVSKNKFKTMIDKGAFAEWAVVHGNFYGTSTKKLLDLCKKGYDVVLDIDVQGAVQMRHSFKDSVFIFILPPTMKILEERLRSRKSDSPQVIRKRLQTAREEIRQYRNYDFVITNDDLRTALKEMESIIISNRLKTEKLDSKLIKKLK
jgi:guanylate kinase